MAISDPCRPGRLTKAANHDPALDLAGVRALAADPAILPAASAYARRFYPKAGALARALQCGDCESRLDTDWRCPDPNCPHRSVA